MKRILAPAVTAVLVLTACSENSQSPLAPETAQFDVSSPGTVQVSNAANAGPGSFRQAIEEANNNSSVSRIEFFAPATIVLHEPVVYTGTQSLTIEGNQATLDGHKLAAGETAFLANGGGDLEVSSLTVRKAPGVGITVAVPGTATGTVKVSLLNVSVINNGSHGVLINDQAEYFIDPNSTSTEGSAASLEVVVRGSSSQDNGFTDLDQDGVRINEGGAGDLRATLGTLRVEGNGGDGIELDERGVGDVVFSLTGSALNGNGSFSAADFDDGIDVDEGGAGSIIGNVLQTSANDNFEQGFDLNENDAGDLRVDMTQVEALNNQQEGIEYEEDDDVAGGGDIVATLVGVTTKGNGAVDGDAGLKLREKGVGNLNTQLIGVESSANFVDGILLREDADGTLTGRIQASVTNGNTGDGIEFDENAGGNLDGTVEQSTSSNNTEAGVRADQGGAGIGALLLNAVTSNGNGAGAVIANAGVTVTQTP